MSELRKRELTNKQQRSPRPSVDDVPVVVSLPTADVPAVVGLQRIIRKQQLPLYCGMGRTTIEELIHKGEFPKPIKLSERSVGWLSSELERWQAERIKARDGGKDSSAD